MLRKLCPFSLGKGRLRGNLIATLSEGAYEEAGEGLFHRNCSGSTKSNRCKLKGRNIRLAVRKKFFTVRCWYGLPCDFLGAPILSVFTATLNKALSNLV